MSKSYKRISTVLNNIGLSNIGLSNIGLSNTGYRSIGLCVIALSCTLAVTEAKADKIYKIVDESGKVTYTSTPPENADADKETSTIDVAAPPSEERVEAAQRRHERNIEAAEQMDENRNQRSEMISEENRLKRERQKQAAEQFKQQEPASEEEHYGYPYLPRPRPPLRPRPPVAVPLPH